MNETKINELTDKISKVRAILNDLTTQLEAEKNKVNEKKEPSIEDRWKPEMWDDYYSVTDEGTVSNMWNNDPVDVEYYKYYNIWEDADRAEEVFNKTKLLWLLEQVHDILCPDYKPDWNNKDENKYYVHFEVDNKIWLPCCVYKLDLDKVFTYFNTEEHAEQACKILNDMGVHTYPYGRV